jgi:hypothetical protein
LIGITLQDLGVLIKYRPSRFLAQKRRQKHQKDHPQKCVDLTGARMIQSQEFTLEILLPQGIGNEIVLEAPSEEALYIVMLKKDCLLCVAVRGIISSNIERHKRCCSHKRLQLQALQERRLLKPADALTLFKKFSSYTSFV